jgi:hypothetical protein
MGIFVKFAVTPLTKVWFYDISKIPDCIFVKTHLTLVEQFYDTTVPKKGSDFLIFPLS